MTVKWTTTELLKDHKDEAEQLVELFSGEAIAMLPRDDVVPTLESIYRACDTERIWEIQNHLGNLLKELAESHTAKAYSEAFNRRDSATGGRAAEKEKKE